MPRHVAWFAEASVASDERGGLTSTLASTRYRCLIPHRELQKAGVKSVILCGNLYGVGPQKIVEFLHEFDVETVVIGKTNHPSMIDLAGLARSHGCYLVADFCDDHFGVPALGPLYRELARLADQIVAGTPQMAEVVATETGRRAVIIPDPYEGPRGEPRFAPGGERLKLLWFGNVTNIDGLNAVLPELASLSREQPMRLTIVTDEKRINVPAGAGWPSSLELSVVPWSVDRLWSEIAGCDLVIIPSLKTREKLVKGANRLVETIWGGRAVVAHPLPTYEEFRDFCWLGDSIAQGIDFTMRNRHLVSARLAAGQALISERYAPAIVAEQWKQCFAGLRLRPPSGVSETRHERGVTG